MDFSNLLNEWWTALYFLILRPMYKLVLKWITGKCELLRITYSESSQVDKIMDVENSLRQSRSAELKSCIVNTDFDVTEAVGKIQALKSIVPEVHPRFQVSFEDSLSRIRAYNRIIAEAESLRKIKYSSENEDHEAKLKKLWNLYNPEKALPSRVGSHWTDIGFQGDNPATDFRGMGLLGLEQLIFFAEVYPQQAQQVLSQSHHPQFGFSFAIVGINLTEMGLTLLVNRKMRSYFYDVEKREPDLVDFHHVYCHLFHGFAQQWISERPKTIMEFGRVRDKYLQRIKGLLRSHDTALLSSFGQAEAKDS